MEEGALRVDANVSIHKDGEPLGTRTEIKNIGSIRGVAGAIRHEIERQRMVLENGGVISNETRSWDATTRVTVPMRDKEVVQDYRYMPEPNLPPLRVNLASKEDTQDVISIPLLQETLPELPEESRQNLMKKYDLKLEVAIRLVNEPTLFDMFNQLLANSSRNPTKLANLIINELLSTLNKRNLDLEDCSIPNEQLGEIFDLLTERKIDLEICKKIFDELLNRNDELSILELINDKGWLLVTDEAEINKICTEVIESNPKLVQLYRKGKVKVFGALLGILAKNNQNKLDMAVASKRLENLLKNDKN